ncbi:MAG: NAD(P)H-dependent oxidoreductase [Pseudomonadota bacterium]|jgi:FMN-dependent NADH-azoreductase|nr:NAD(P)H-dependent oxidoreductase [Pseudomonadota bacterium]
MTHTLLRIDASARRDGSVSRQLTDQIIEKLTPDHVIARDLANPLPHVNEAWISANFTPVTDRNDEQHKALELSDTLIEEVQQADTIVIGAPIYNFGVPAGLKAWIDLVARAGVTFRYTEEGPVGLLTGKRTIVVVASGGTEAGSNYDFATGFLKHVLGFIGLTDVEFVTADKLALDAEGTIRHAQEQVDQLAA